MPTTNRLSRVVSCYTCPMTTTTTTRMIVTHLLGKKKKRKKIKGNPEGEKPTFDLHAHHTLVHTRSDCTH